MPDERRGKLKIFMGYAAGVGKTYQMLEEAQELKSKGVDVVVGYFEPHGRKDTIAKAEGPGDRAEEEDRLPRIPPSKRWIPTPSWRRRPEVAVVDEFPHTNVPGSERGKRWEDVEVLLDAGIDVLTTMNIQHLESLNDQVWHVTGIRVRETIPDWVVQQADEVVMIDLTPRALLHRLERGVVYGQEKPSGRCRTSSANRLWSRFGNSRCARRRTRWSTGIGRATKRPQHRKGRKLSAEQRRHHRILVHVTADPQTAMLIRRAKRVSDFLGAECFAVAVQPSRDLSTEPESDREAIDRHLNFARNLHIETRILEGEDIAATLVDFARRNQITQIFFARPPDRQWLPLLSRNLVQKVVALAKDMQIVIVSEREAMTR